MVKVECRADPEERRVSREPEKVFTGKFQVEPDLERCLHHPGEGAFASARSVVVYLGDSVAFGIV